jgi:hypothetical protein
MPSRVRQLTKRKMATKECEKPVNCWQYMSCGRESGGLNADRLGVCPASTDRRLHGIHGGKNGGRACWVIAGLLTREVFGNVSKGCSKCDFYLSVKSEEGKYIWPDAFILRLLKRQKNRPKAV